MRAVAYVNKFLRAKGRGGGGNNFKNLDSLLGLNPVLVPPKFLGRFTPLQKRTRAQRSRTSATGQNWLVTDDNCSSDIR